MKGTLKEGEVHPASHDAMRYIRSLGPIKLCKLLEVFTSTAIEGNRTAEICGETLRRILEQEPVSDRYLLGLASTILTMTEEE